MLYRLMPVYIYSNISALDEFIDRENTVAFWLGSFSLISGYARTNGLEHLENILDI